MEGWLGRGGFGAVVSARRQPDGAPVALKIARADLPAAQAQLAREAQVLRAVGPPAVPALHGEGTLPDGSPYLVLERVSLPTLADRLAASPGLLPLDEAGARALALLEALAAVHAAGFAHCDLKPENVFVTEAPPAVRLFDLGLAERLGGEAPPADPGAYAGTAEYMAPEQIEGRLRPDARADIYAAGVVLYEMLTGRPPFFGAEGEVRQAHLDRRPARPSQLAPVPRAVEEVVLRCLAKDREARFGSVAALKDALSAALAQGATASAPAPSARPGPASAAPLRRTVGVVFLESTAEALSLQRAAAAYGGQVAHAALGRCALVFDAAGTQNPARLALRGAEGLVARRIAPRALVDLATVAVQQRRDGLPRYLSAAFAKPESYPRLSDPEGALATARVAELAPDEQYHPAGREGLLVALPRPDVPEQPTVVRQGAGPLVGRDEILSALLARAEQALERHAPALASVVGDPGCGKSHLGAVLAQRLRLFPSAPDVLELRCREPVGAEPDATLRSLLNWSLGLREAAGSGPPDGGEALLTAALPEALAAESWPAVALVLGWLSPEAPEILRRAAAPGALRSLAVRAAGESLRRRAAARSLCILLDDAQFADGAALDALEYAALAEGAAPLFVCALARPAFDQARPSWGERAADRARLELGPLPPEPAAELCRRLLHPVSDLPARAVERLVARSSGVPMLLVELIRSLKRGGLLRPREHGGAWFLATDEIDRIPDMPLVDWLAEREIGGLSPDLAAHARLLALLGEEVAPADVSGILAEMEREGAAAAFPLDAQAGILRLVSAGILVRHRSARIGFRSPLVREAIARTVPEGLRARIHETAFRFYRDGTAVEPARRLPLLAAHAAASGHREIAADVELRLADDLRARHAYLQAESLYNQALSHLADSDRPGRLAGLRGRGLMRTRVGRFEDAVADLAGAAEVARQLSDAAAEMECLLDQATARDWMNDYVSSARLVRQAESVAPAPPTPRLALRLRLGRARTLFRESRWAEACAAAQATAREAEGLGDEGYEPQVIALLMMAVILPNLGRAADAEAVLERAARLCQDRGDLLHLAVVFNNRRNLHVSRGNLAGALEDEDRSTRIGRELGIAAIEYFAEYNAGELLYQAGDAAAAEPHVRRALEIEARHPESAPLPVGLLLSARLLAFRGDLPEARGRLEEFRAAVQRAGAGELGPSFQVLAAAVDLATREATAAEWHEVLERSRRFSVEQEPIEVQELRGLAALRAGRLDEAREALEAALRLAGAIPNLMGARIRRALAGIGAG